MKLLIFGASGKTGRHLVTQALNEGYQVTAFARDPSKIETAHSNLEIAAGDVSDYQKVEEAINGHDAVLSALGASRPFRFDQSVVDGMNNIIKAMLARQVHRLIYLSFVGVKESSHTGGFVIRYIAPKILSTEIRGHEAREKMIELSALKWTIVRAATLTNGPKKGNYRSGENISANGFTATISRADVADFMLRLLNDADYLRKKPAIMY